MTETFESDPEHPYNWPFWRKVSIGMIYSLGQLVTLMSASMIAPALNDIAADLHMTASTAQLSFSVFFLGLGFAPFLVAPLSEAFGRKPLWFVCNLWYILWNALCPVGNSQAMLVVGRLLSATGASVGVSLSGPVMADMFKPEKRGQSQAISALLPYLGPALGPIVGGLLTDHIRWQWLFWVLSIFDAGIVVLGVFAIKETYAPILLQRKLELESGKPGAAVLVGNESRYSSLRQRLRTVLVRPVRILFTRPIIQILTLILSIDFGVYTFVLSSYADLWIDKYNQSGTSSSLHYIAIAIGATLAAQVGGRFMDWIWGVMKRRHPDQEPVPEYRIPHMVLPALLFPLTMFWYGWSAEYGLTWPVVDVGVAAFTMGNFMFTSGPYAYILDEFHDQAASAMAATRMFSYVLGFAFPLFAPQLYAALGYGWGNGLLAFLFYLFAIPVIAMLWFYGPRLRAIGRE
ncbi:major facilitator superfamily domain-containing protein [Xylariales sp. PMI_506]|nr:major facilitator superfamily domain-containing protein [Xylariales sp. PMI_506]